MESCRTPPWGSWQWTAHWTATSSPPCSPLTPERRASTRAGVWATFYRPFPLNDWLVPVGPWMSFFFLFINGRLLTYSTPSCRWSVLEVFISMYIVLGFWLFLRWGFSSPRTWPVLGNRKSEQVTQWVDLRRFTFLSLFWKAAYLQAS